MYTVYAQEPHRVIKTSVWDTETQEARHKKQKSTTILAKRGKY